MLHMALVGIQTICVFHLYVLKEQRIKPWFMLIEKEAVVLDPLLSIKIIETVNMFQNSD
jgi:hypothetical protein